MSSIQTCGNVIRDLRLRQGLTQLQLAELASVSERTIRSAEKNQRISCTHVTYIAEALGVATIHIAQSPIGTTNGIEVSAMHQIWKVMFGRLSALSIESNLHCEIRIHSCGEVADFPHPERFFRRYSGTEDCRQFFELISEYFNSIGPLNVRIAELYRCRSAMVLQGRVCGTSIPGIPKALRLISFATLEEERVQTFIIHMASVADEDFESVADVQMPPDWSDLEARRQVAEFAHFL